MKKSALLLYAGIFALATTVILVACKKNNSSSSDDQATAASLSTSATTSESLYGDVFDVVVQTGDENGLAGTANTSSGGEVLGGANQVDSNMTCATVTISPMDSTFPKTMTIDFGDGCTSITGITRKGKIMATVSGPLSDPGTTVSVTFDNYFVNGYQLEGTYSITNSSSQASGIQWTTTITGGKVTFPDQSWYSYTETKMVTQTGGIGTSDISDDVFSIAGGYTCTSSAGKSVTATVTTDLVKEMSCKNIVSGVVKIIYNTIPATLDFGSGDCDNQATLTVGLKTYPVTLPR